MRETANVQNTLTVLKALLIAALFVAGLSHLAAPGSSGPATLSRNMEPTSNTNDDDNDNDYNDNGGGGGSGGGGRSGGEDGASVVAGVARAIIPCLWAFDGWADLGSLAEEMRHPERDLPRVILLSIAVVSALYLLCNVAYL